MNETNLEEGLRIVLRNKYDYQVLGADEPVICESYPTYVIQNTGIFTYKDLKKTINLSFYRPEKVWRKTLDCMERSITDGMRVFRFIRGSLRDL